ncbi:MAG TPA: DUF6252 family protein [Candidatus Kapabacteria bacterium]|nr:DUF6252 family protein [Candidatus Kapabacteria bacterium]
MNRYQNLIFASLSILILAGCKASTSPTGTTTTPGSMIAHVNGSAWSSTVLPGISGGATGNIESGALFVTGLSATTNTEITIELMNPKLGTDSLGATGDEGVYSQIAGADTTFYYSIPLVTSGELYDGAVTITAYDSVGKTISGTFNFVARTKDLSSSVSVTNGSFYQVSWK